MAPALRPIAKPARYDDDSDGYCEDDEAIDPLFNPFGLFGPVVVAGKQTAGVIPVTGGMNELSCAEANTLVLANGNSVAFSAPLCELRPG